MNAQAYSYIDNTGCLFRENKCNCGKTPAIKLMADCCGDVEGPYCKQCWINWLNNTLLPEFDKEENFNYKQLDSMEEVKEIYKEAVKEHLKWVEKYGPANCKIYIRKES